jgi:hypothetical protein
MQMGFLEDPQTEGAEAVSTSDEETLQQLSAILKGRRR